MSDCLLKLALPTQQRTFAVIVQNGIVVRHGAVQIQQVGQQIPLVAEDGLIDQVFGQGGIGAQVGFGQVLGGLSAALGCFRGDAAIRLNGLGRLRPWRIVIVRHEGGRRGNRAERKAEQAQCQNGGMAEDGYHGG